MTRPEAPAATEGGIRSWSGAISTPDDRIARVLPLVLRQIGRRPLASASEVVRRCRARSVDARAAIRWGRAQGLIIDVVVQEENIRGARRPVMGLRLADHPLPGPSLRDARIRAGWSQSALSKAIGVSQAILSRWESGQSPPPGRLVQLGAILAGPPVAPQHGGAPSAQLSVVRRRRAAREDEVAMFTGSQVRDLRERKGLLQRQLAELVGVRRDTVARWEQGKRSVRGHSADRLRQLMDKLPDAPTYPPLSGDELLGMRKEVGLSQDRLAAAIGVSQSAVVSWERGRGVPPARLAAVRRALSEAQPPPAPPSGADLLRWRKDAGWSQKRMAVELGVKNPVTIAKWETGDRQVRDFLEPVRRLLATSPPDPPTPQPPLLGGAELRRLLGQTDLSQARLARELGVSPASVCHWLQGHVPDAHVKGVRTLLEAAAAQRVKQKAAPTRQKIARLREGAGWSQSELASRVGVTRNVVARWEQGKYPPQPHQVPPLRSALAAALRVVRSKPPAPAGPPPTAQEIMQLRASYGWSWPELASRVGVSNKVVMNWGHGTTPVPPMYWEQLHKLADDAPAL